MNIPPNGGYAAPTQYMLSPEEKQRAYNGALVRTHSYLLNQAMDIQAEGHVTFLSIQFGSPIINKEGKVEPDTTHIRYVHIIKNLYINLTQLQARDTNAFRRAAIECQGLVPNEIRSQQQSHNEGHNLFLAWYKEKRDAQRAARRAKASAGASGHSGPSQVMKRAEPQHTAPGAGIELAAEQIVEDLATIQARFFARECKLIQLVGVEAIKRNQANFIPDYPPLPPSPDTVQQATLFPNQSEFYPIGQVETIAQTQAEHGPEYPPRAPSPLTDEERALVIHPIALHLYLAGAGYIDSRAEEAARAEIERIAADVRLEAQAERQALADQLMRTAQEEALCLGDAIEQLRQSHFQADANPQFPGQNVKIDSYLGARSQGETERRSLLFAGCRDQAERELVMNRVSDILSQRRAEEAANAKIAAEAAAAASSIQRELAREAFHERTNARASLFADDPEGQKKRIEQVLEENNRMLQRAMELQAEGKAGPFRWPDRSNDNICRQAAVDGAESSMEYKLIVKRIWQNFTEVSKVAIREGVSLRDPNAPEDNENL
jgi:hypothetical protein